MKTRDPLGPHSLALAEAVLLPLRAAGFPDRDAGLAFFLILDDYTIGFEVSSPRISVNEQRVRDAATRDRLHEFFRSLPGDRFPTLIALGEHVWLDNRDERFAAGINALVDGLEQIQRPVGFQNLAVGVDVRVQAAGSYSLISPPSIGRRLIRWPSKPGAG